MQLWEPHNRAILGNVVEKGWSWSWNFSFHNW